MIGRIYLLILFFLKLPKLLQAVPSSQPTSHPTDYFFNKIQQKQWMLDNFAGTGVQGYTTENTKAINANIYPFAIFGDSSGNLFSGTDYRVSKIDAQTGNISTILGTSIAGAGLRQTTVATDVRLFVGDIWIDSLGNLFCVDIQTDVIRKLTPVGIQSVIVGNYGWRVWNLAENWADSMDDHSAGWRV